ncbi:MAG: hypothetical protein JWM19_6945 [Actinomycetia bacterium]|nr:hypothetical protein [Actinomycetes bacterium]
MSHEGGLDWGRTLRLTGSALANTTDVDGIGTIVGKAVGDLIGHQPNSEALFAVRMRHDDELTVVAISSGELVPSNELARLVPRWLPRMRLPESDEPRLLPAAGLDPEEKAAAVRAGFESLLVCPLVLGNRSSGDPLIGVLAIFGEHQMLSGMSSALGILATQAALALERLLLCEEVVRQRGAALFRTLVQDVLDVILVYDDDDMTIKYASPSATRVYGDIPIEGARLDTLIASFEQVTAHPAAGRATIHPGPVTSEEGYRGLWRITRHDGQRLLVEARFSDLRHDETIRGLVLTVRNVTEEHQLEDQLKYQAFHDTLTGLPNRALFTDRAEHALSIARRNRTITAMLFVDLDDFKVVNDTMGHAVGDELLGKVAGRLRAVARRSDTAARLGGDEFALLIENLPDAAAAETFADRVVIAFSEPFQLSAGSVLAGATVGVATTADSSDVGELLRHADMSLYAAKSEGKRRWHRYSPALCAAMTRRRQMQKILEDTIAKSAFTLDYQPIVELATGAIRGFEALVRWPRPAGEAVPPEELTELAEETGLIIPLGSWVVRQAITDMARWRGTDPRQPDVGVNVSARQFRDPGFVPGLRRWLDETGLAPSAVVLELTESSLMSRDERITSGLAQLKDLGVRLAIDDFSTGSCSLMHLKELPIDALKIGKPIVDAITEPQGRKFAELIIGFADAMEIEVIAEGIDTDEQRALLTEMGCQLGQGPLLGMPIDRRAMGTPLRAAGRAPGSSPWPGPCSGG